MRVEHNLFSDDCVNASSVNVFKNKINIYLILIRAEIVDFDFPGNP